MRYVVAGYTIVLSILFLYGLQLLWRRRRLTRAVARVSASPPAGVPSASAATPIPVATTASPTPTPAAGDGAVRS